MIHYKIPPTGLFSSQNILSSQSLLSISRKKFLFYSTIFFFHYEKEKYLFSSFEKKKQLFKRKEDFEKQILFHLSSFFSQSGESDVPLYERSLKCCDIVGTSYLSRCSGGKYFPFCTLKWGGNIFRKLAFLGRVFICSHGN